MSFLQPGQSVSKYTVQSLIKAGIYCETYKVCDENGMDLFLKLYIEKLTPKKLFLDGQVCEIKFCQG